MQKRTLSDILFFRGEENAVRIAACIRWVFRYEAGRTPSLDEALDRFDQSPEKFRKAAIG